MTPEEFGGIVRKRREQLGMTQLGVHAAGGPSNSTMTLIENGRIDHLEPPTARKLDKGLGWISGTARSLWNGTVPTPEAIWSGPPLDLTFSPPATDLPHVTVSGYSRVECRRCGFDGFLPAGHGGSTTQATVSIAEYHSEGRCSFSAGGASWVST